MPGTFTYQTTNPLTNELTGAPNTPVDIAAGVTQTFFFAFVPSALFGPADVQLSYRCANTNPAPVVGGLNTLLLSASAMPAPDIVAVASTLTADGIVDLLGLPGFERTGLFTVATVNMGAGDTLTVSADPEGTMLPISTSICQTDPNSGLLVFARS